MTKKILPHFVIKKNSQKGGYSYEEILTPEILSDVNRRVTGCTEYTCEFIEEGYNKGRLAVLEYQGKVSYVSFSETGKIEGRNYFFQSLTTALIRYYQDTCENKQIFFYFLPLTGNIETDYYKFMYRLMATDGVGFLNGEDILEQRIHPFTTMEDLILAREKNKSRNKGNNSTYLTKSTDGVTQIFGKTYGASKKETALLCIALSRIASSPVELYEICEQNLTVLPKPDLKVIQSFGKVKVIPTDLTMEKKEFEKGDSLRSPRYTYNLLEKLGPKRCVLCGCEVAELIEGAHIWPVADIRRAPAMSAEEKFACATDGENGIWLCENHHKMFDVHLLQIDLAGEIKCKPDIDEKSKDYIWKTTPVTRLPSAILTDSFHLYLQKRYKLFAGDQKGGITGDAADY